MSEQALSASGREWRSETVSLGMWVFLLTEVMFFGVLFLAYFHVRHGDPEGFGIASRHVHEWLGTLNTAILLTSSLSMAFAVRAAAEDDRKALLRLLIVTALLGVAFLGVKGTEYFLEWNDGLVPRLNFEYAGPHPRTVAEFFFLYFVMTGVHAVHLTIGIGAVAWNALRARRDAHVARREDAIEAVGLYWHFVDVIWVFLYPLFYLVLLYR
ncbi:MAG TPA: cytochrome c oxidase subunit 3 [Usitatibacter sp.]|jgi:cytochrome c oxidase subunit 3|nr:cytochrome c oxidase subunit 3 [Usitatibacter sp.]